MRFFSRFRATEIPSRPFALFNSLFAFIAHNGYGFTLPFLLLLHVFAVSLFFLSSTTRGAVPMYLYGMESFLRTMKKKRNVQS